MQAKKQPRAKKRPTLQPLDRPPRERILHGAFDAIMELGYAETSMLEIATRARVSKRDLYALFADKGAILAACVETRARRMRLPLELPPPEDRAALSDALIKFGMASLREGTLPSSVAALRLAAVDAEAGRVFTDVALDANHRALTAFLAKAQERGLLRPGEPRQKSGFFLGQLWRNTLLRLLLRVDETPTEAEIESHARDATRLLFLVFGT